MSNFTVSFRAMGCHIQVWLNVPTAADAEILTQVPAQFEIWEQSLSRFRPTSELCRLNAQSGEWLCVSGVLFDAIRAAKEAAWLTDGIVTPLILPALEAAGYDHSFTPDNFEPGTGKTGEVVPDWQGIRLDYSQRRVFLPAGARIDVGGTAKGWAAQQTATSLSVYGPCLVDAGGDLVARGVPSDVDSAAGWLVTIPLADAPRQILLRDAAVATSGADYRHWQRNGQELHHIIDPRTGLPAQSEILTATVVAPDAVQAEAWAKATLVNDSVSDLPTLMVRRNGAVLCSESFEFLLQ